MADVLTIDDLIADKKHSTFFAEVVTGKTGGLSTGPDISTATNQVTGQTQKTLPQVLADLGMVVQTWTATSGGTLTNAAQVFLNNKVGSTGLGNYYAWSGTFPKVITAGLDPAITAGFIQRTDIGLRRELTDEGTSVDDLSKLNTPAGATKIQYTRGSSHCVPATVARKFLTVRHCSDWGINCDGSDETTKLQNLVSDINAIPNTNGHPVRVVFSGQSDSLAPILKFTNTVNFTRPVHLDFGREVYINYTGASGNAFEFGPDGLTGSLVQGTDTDLHKYYSVEGAGASGGTTSGKCFYFKPWVLYPSVYRCRFEAFGGDGSWAVYAQYNNWSTVVQECEFWGKNGTHSDDSIKRNFVGCPGVKTDGTTLDQFATRLNAIDNWVYSGGYAAGGIAYLVSGWKSRIVGGGIEGPYTGVIVGAGCNDVEISCYWESIFSNTPAPRFIQLSYSGDPYFASYPWVKRLNIHDTYANMHNNDSLASNGRFLLCANNVKVIDPLIDKVTLVHSAYPMLELPDIAGHSGINIDKIKQDGNIGAQTYIMTTGYASLYKPSFDTKVKNYAKLSDFSDIVTGFSGVAAPLSSNFGITTLSIQSDGTGGSFVGTKISSNNTSGTGYERYHIGQQLNYGLFQCTAIATGQTYVTLTFPLDAKLPDLQGEDIVVSFLAKAYTNPVLVKAVHSFIGGEGLSTQSTNTQTLIVGDWYQYAMKISVPQIAPGTDVSNGNQVIQLVLPPRSLFSFAIAAVMVNIGQIAYPLQAAV